MTQKAVRLIDVLAPPGNDWLTELSRRRADLPPGVHIVRFGDDDDAAEACVAGARAKPRKKEAA